MPAFTQQDFLEQATRLSVIIMSQMGKPPLTRYTSLPDGQKAKFNRLMNSFIRSLGEDWNDALLAQFNQIVSEDILNDDFKPEQTFIREVSTTRELILTDEQAEYFASEPEELAKIK